jgi:Glu-tRNA(Gln) amidotransferase subunit E-like FAD-binding protein
MLQQEGKNFAIKGRRGNRYYSSKDLKDIVMEYFHYRHFDIDPSGFITSTLKSNNAEGITSSKLEQVVIHGETKSHILLENEKILWFSVYKGLSGSFKKDNLDSASFQLGRVICDIVKDMFECHGFFTSDELPRYGISRKNTKDILTQVREQFGEDIGRDLLVFFSYDHDFSLILKNFLDKLLESIIDKS